MTACRHEHEDGAYVLGALSPEDRAAFERHLDGCTECSASVRDLAGLPGLLARVPQGVLEGGEPSPPVPDTLLPSLVRRARRTRRRRTWLVAAAAVVAVLATAGVGTAVLLGQDEDRPVATASAAPPTAAPRPLEPVGAVPLSGWVSLTPVGWGTRLDLTCTYADRSTAWSDGQPVTYAMYVSRRDGTSEQVASWRALPGRTMHLSAATAALRGDVVDVEVRTSTGAPVLRLK